MGVPSNQVTDGSPWIKFALVCLAVALLLHLIAFGTPHWAKTDTSKVDRDEYFGMWQYCTTPSYGRQLCQDFIYYGNTGDWLKACQAFTTLGFFALLPSIVLVLLCAFVDGFQNETLYQVLGLVCTLIAGVFLLIGIAVFAGKYEEYFRDRELYYRVRGNIGQLSWGFGLDVSAAFLTFVAAVLIVVEMAVGGEDY